MILPSIFFRLKGSNNITTTCDMFGNLKFKIVETATINGVEFVCGPRIIFTLKMTSCEVVAGEELDMPMNNFEIND